MSDHLPAEPIGLDKHDPASMAAWLRVRAKANRDLAHVPPQQWEVNVLPHIAFRLDQAADMIERLEFIQREFRNLDDVLEIRSLRLVLTGIASCSTCEVCQRAASGALTRT